MFVLCEMIQQQLDRSAYGKQHAKRNLLRNSVPVISVHSDKTVDVKRTGGAKVYSKCTLPIYKIRFYSS